ncbi:phage major tail tube protein [Bartonella sp. DGB2]|uniref:phage major tail tube protein n=1 Tax=Bartonella sp. DGB2 TaxID=3388426 RepID=UPI003990314F
MALPRLLKHFNLYLDGRSYLGRVDSVTLPNLTVQVESHRAAGMNGPVEIELGLDVMTMQMVISDYDPKLLTLFSTPNTPLILRGSVQAQGSKEEPVVISVRGLQKGLNFGQWQGGQKTTQTIDYTLSYFRYEQDNVEYAEIDIVNMIQRIGGVDQLAAHRTNIGL